jgi:uncharacterized protein
VGRSFYFTGISRSSPRRAFFLCHPERRHLIRFANGMTKSKDPWQRNGCLANTYPDTTVKGIGVLRLRICFAMRSIYSAEDDIVRFSSVSSVSSVVVSDQAIKRYNPPMSLSEQIQKDIITSMKARDEHRLSTLRMVKTALKNREIEKMSPLDDKESQQVLTTLIKQRKDSVEQFTKGGRQEMADKEAAEITLIEAYMPKAASEDQVIAGVRAVIAEMGAPTMKEMGTVMKNVMARFSGAGIRVDGKQVSDAVKRELAGK